MDEQEGLEREREKEKARRKEKSEQRKKAVRREVLLLAAVVVVIAAGLIFGLSRLNRKGEERVAEGIAATGAPLMAGAEGYGNIDDGGWEEAEYLEYETFDDMQGERETLQAGHIWQDLPKIDVLLSISPYDHGWTAYAADNRCLLAPFGSFVTGMRATLKNQASDMTGTVEYSANVSGYGWIDWQADTAEAGSSGTTVPLEAIRMRLTGELEYYYDILYCVYQNGEWTDWVSNGEEAGESGKGFRVDGIRASVSRKWPGEPSYAGEINPNRPMVALTYDDGPSKSVTPRILDKLQSAGGRATFFMVGNQAERNPDIVKRMVEQGCEVGNHTYDHIDMNKLSAQELDVEIERASAVIYDCCGIYPLIVRPPSGNETESGMAVLGALSMPAILWSVDTRDWKTRDAQQTITTVLNNVKDGDIVLMHDLYDATGDASMTIIDELVARGYQLVTVSELSAYRGGLKPQTNYKQFRPR